MIVSSPASSAATACSKRTRTCSGPPASRTRPAADAQRLHRRRRQRHVHVVRRLRALGAGEVREPSTSAPRSASHASSSSYTRTLRSSTPSPKSIAGPSTFDQRPEQRRRLHDPLRAISTIRACSRFALTHTKLNRSSAARSREAAAVATPSTAARCSRASNCSNAGHKTTPTAAPARQPPYLQLCRPNSIAPSNRAPSPPPQALPAQPPAPPSFP